MGLVYDILSQEYLDCNKSIDINLTPPGLQNIAFDSYFSKEVYIERGFKEKKVGNSHQQPHFLRRNIQAQRKFVV